MLLQFEKELAQAVEALTKEQQKAAQAEKEKQTQVKKAEVFLHISNSFISSVGRWVTIYCTGSRAKLWSGLCLINETCS